MHRSFNFKQYFIKFSNLLLKHAIVVIIVSFCLTASVIFFYLDKLSDQQIKQQSLKNAEIYTGILSEFRSLYTSEVIGTVRKNDIKITHNYTEYENAIPLPATFSMLLGNRIGGNESGVKSKLYSAYPFPWRLANGGLTDEFSKQAWQALQQNPRQPYFRFEQVNGFTSIRYASADVMRESCVDCHNTHPDSPKLDWKVGDVRGVLEVIIPIESNINSTNDVILHTVFLLTLMLVISVCGIALVIHKLKRRTMQANELAVTTNNMNKLLEAEIGQRHQAEIKLLEISLTDSLTGIGNRRKFDEELTKQWQQARRHTETTTLAIILVDIDYFKLFNDNYGHQQGDSTLTKVAGAMNQVTQRGQDLLCRYGGEEFVILLPHTDLEGAMAVAENIRVAVESLAIPHEFSLGSKIVTVSAGVAIANPKFKTKAEDLIKTADEALYLAKKSGRNCVANKKSNKN